MNEHNVHSTWVRWSGGFLLQPIDALDPPGTTGHTLQAIHEHTGIHTGTKVGFWDLRLGLDKRRRRPAGAAASAREGGGGGIGGGDHPGDAGGRAAAGGALRDARSRA